MEKAIKSSIVKSDKEFDDDFMPSQQLHSYQGFPIINGQKEQKCCTHGKKVPDNARAICDLICQITSKRYKKIKLNIEIENDSD